MSESSSGGSGAGWIPILQWMPSYDGNRFRLDLIAGLSLAAFTIPESLAYASLAQLPPITGLYCYLVAGIAYAIFGTSRQLAVGPTSALAIVIATSIATLGAGDVTRTLGLASALALIVGIVSIAGRGIGLANAAYFISDPILTGFKAGAALYIASTQLPKLFGIEGIKGNFFGRIARVIRELPATHMPSLLMGSAAIVLFAATPVPGPADHAGGHRGFHHRDVDVGCRCNGDQDRRRATVGATRIWSSRYPGL